MALHWLFQAIVPLSSLKPPALKPLPPNYNHPLSLLIAVKYRLLSHYPFLLADLSSWITDNSIRTLHSELGSQYLPRWFVQYSFNSVFLSSLRMVCPTPGLGHSFLCWLHPRFFITSDCFFFINSTLDTPLPNCSLWSFRSFPIDVLTWTLFQTYKDIKP